MCLCQGRIHSYFPESFDWEWELNYVIHFLASMGKYDFILLRSIEMLIYINNFPDFETFLV